MKAGATAHDVHRAVSKGFVDRGFQLGHVTGHSIGMTMIEHPRIGEGVETVLEENMVFSMHPHAFTDDGHVPLHAGHVACRSGRRRAARAAADADLLRCGIALELPGAAVQHGDALAGGGDAGDRDLVAADHEVRSHLAHVQPGRSSGRTMTGRRCQREVARGVLVEQVCRDVPSRPIRPAPSTSATSPRRRRRRRSRLAAQRVRAAPRPVADDPPALEAQLEPADDDVRREDTVRRPDDAVHPLRIGRGEGLLGRQVGQVHDPVDRDAPAALPAAARQRAVGEVPSPAPRSGPRRSGGRSTSPSPCRAQRVALPRRRPGRPSRRQSARSLPQRRQRFLRLDQSVRARRPMPASGRARTPVDRPLVDELHVSFSEGIRSFATGAGSRSSKSVGVTVPSSAITAARISPSERARSPYHGGTQSIVSSAACSTLMRFTHGSN